MQWTPWRMKWLFNFYPPYFFTRTRITHIAPDWKKVVVKLKKSLLTRNYVGTTFGGSLYAATDPHFMLMLIQILGIRDYIVWDQASTITFKKPARSDITFTFTLTDDEIEKIRQDAAVHEKIRPEFTVEGIDEKGEVCVVVKKVIYIRLKSKDIF